MSLMQAPICVELPDYLGGYSKSEVQLSWGMGVKKINTLNAGPGRNPGGRCYFMLIRNLKLTIRFYKVIK